MDFVLFYCFVRKRNGELCVALFGISGTVISSSSIYVLLTSWLTYLWFLWDLIFFTSHTSGSIIAAVQMIPQSCCCAVTVIIILALVQHCLLHRRTLSSDNECNTVIAHREHTNGCVTVRKMCSEVKYKFYHVTFRCAAVMTKTKWSSVSRIL